MVVALGPIDADAERVVRKLARHGHRAYLVGGCVRDLLLGRKPKDFDVATSATPNEIRELFRNSRIIGRRFRLAHIFFGSKIIETSTFRTNPRNLGKNGDSLLIRRDNVFGSDTEDARRRDFTINGLFYNVETKTVIDHVGGLADLEAKLVRTIGEPGIRFQEDPVRMLRAIKFAARLGLEIETDTYAAIVRHRDEINQCAPPRVLEEFYRLLRGGAARRSFELLNDSGIDSVLCPTLAAMFRGTNSLSLPNPGDDEEALWHETWADERDETHDEFADDSDDAPTELALSFATPTEFATRRRWAWDVLDQLDRLAATGYELGNALLLSAIMSPFLSPSMVRSGIRPSEARAMFDELTQPLLDKLRVARRDRERMRQILLTQRQLPPSRRRRGRGARLVRQEHFDEALTVYELTTIAMGQDTADVQYWHQLRDEHSDRVSDGGEAAGKRRRRRRGGRRRRRTEIDDFQPNG